MDILIIGAGISGIGMARYVSEFLPDKSFAILERRENLGGTWDFFRYPGIRCDSDMYTLGYAFKPWKNAKMITQAPDILEYLQETVEETGVGDRIHYGIQVLGADWSSEDATWTVHAKQEESGKKLNFTCAFLLSCTGYYDYDQGYQPIFPGQETFSGTMVHPQHWPDNLDYSGKRVVVIGSGATAITVVPEMAKRAKHVTMLQRSPTYILSLPERDKTVRLLQQFLPNDLVYQMTRYRNALMQIGSFKLSKRHPKLVRFLLLKQVERQIGKDVDMKHFTPHYNPWDERICAAPDGDFFDCIREGTASVVTDKIETFTETGIRLKSGEHLDADIIVSATGLNLKFLGGMALTVDGEEKEISDALFYKALMFSGIPNMAMVMGYANASWTIKVDFAGEYLVRLIKYMDRHHYTACTPNSDPSVDIDEDPAFSLNSGYIQRAEHLLPKTGNKGPWRATDFIRDMFVLRMAPVNDRAMTFTRARRQRRAA